MGQGSASIKFELEPKLQACLRLLNLAVVYVDAILVLSRFVKKISKSANVSININISVLHLPPLSKDMRMLPWKTLLQHQTYFPAKLEPSVKDIVEFLELWASSTGNQRSSQNTNNQSRARRVKSRRKSLCRPKSVPRLS